MQEWVVEDKRRMGYTVAPKKKQTERTTQVSSHVTDLEGEVVKSMEATADFNVKLKVSRNAQRSSRTKTTVRMLACSSLSVGRTK